MVVILYGKISGKYTKKIPYEVPFSRESILKNKKLSGTRALKRIYRYHV